MPISRKIEGFLSKASFIRKMFEEGNRLKNDGKGPVYDFSLGNPQLEPPSQFKEVLLKTVQSDESCTHLYMENIGYEETRSAVAESLEQETGLPFTPGSVIMSVGASGAINTALKAIIDPGDEVIITVPYFVEYLFYIDNHGGVPVKVNTTPDFNLDVSVIEKHINERTKVVIINNPNNPTGVIYPQSTLDDLGKMLKAKSSEIGHPVYLIDDAPYRKIIYDTDRCPSIFTAYENSIMVTSHSKDLGLPGERIGFAAISPRTGDAAELFGAMAFTVRTLGYVNAPALMQRVVRHLQNTTIDIEWYRRKRDLLYRELTGMGYEMPYPGGAFYVFPRAPGKDDVAFTRLMQENRVLVVPGTGFGTPGYFRIAYCFDDSVVEGALPIFRKAIEESAK